MLKLKREYESKLASIAKFDLENWVVNLSFAGHIRLSAVTWMKKWPEENKLCPSELEMHSCDRGEKSRNKGISLHACFCSLLGHQSPEQQQQGKKKKIKRNSLFSLACLKELWRSISRGECAWLVMACTETLTWRTAGASAHGEISGQR